VADASPRLLLAVHASWKEGAPLAAGPSDDSGQVQTWQWDAPLCPAWLGDESGALGEHALGVHVASPVSSHGVAAMAKPTQSHLTATNGQPTAQQTLAKQTYIGRLGWARY